MSVILLVFIFVINEHYVNLREFGLASRCERDLRSSGVLRSVGR